MEQDNIDLSVDWCETIGLATEIDHHVLYRIDQLKTRAIQKAAFFAWKNSWEKKEALECWLEGEKYVNKNLGSLREIMKFLRK